jgi:phosphate starvation-inducible protein PhoH
LTFVHLGAGDVVRHRIVADIVAAYERNTTDRRAERVGPSDRVDSHPSDDRRG